MSSSLTVYSESTDGHMYAGTDSHFSNARDAATADSIDATSTVARIGLDTLYSPDKYGFYRVGLAFDTSAIPDGATILSATLSLYLVYGLTILPGGFEFVLMKMADNDGTYPHNPLVVGDYDQDHYVSGGASSPTVTSGQSGYKHFAFTTAGKSGWINDQGLSKFVVMTSLDIGYVLPGPYMLISVYTEERGAGYRPKLAITYATLCTVTTQAASGITSTGATGNGNITLAGDSVTQHGVIWNDDGTDPVDLASADNTTTEGAGGAGAFTSSITGCDSGTAYYYRAYATTVAGTSYGSAVQFTTSSVASLEVTTQAPSVVGVTTATFDGTIVDDDGGASITQHGFVYKKGNDPGTPADPTTADNYTEEGVGAIGAFTSDVTSLDAASLYFVRAYAETATKIDYGDAYLAHTGTSILPIVIGATSDGQIYAESTGATEEEKWDNGHDDDGSGSGSCSITLDASGDTITSGVGDELGNGEFWRAYFYFDTSSIPAGATIVKAQLCIYMLIVGEPDASLYLKVLSGQPTYPHDPLVADDDYDITNYNGTYGTFEENRTAGVGQFYANTYGFIDITTPDSIVNKGGMTKLCLVNEYDWDDQGTFPTKRSWLRFRSANFGASTAPRLEIFLTGASKDCSFYSMAGDGVIVNDTDGCETIADPSEDLGSESVVETSSTSIALSGAWFVCDVGKYNIDTRRGYVYFDTSTIPSGATILSADLWVYCNEYSYDTATDVLVYDGQPTYPSESGGSPNLSLGDWALSNYSQIATIALSDMMRDKSGSGQQGWTRTVIPTSSITKGGLTKFCLRNISEDDTDDTAIFNSGNNADNKPYLLVNWAGKDASPLPLVNIGDSWVQPTAAVINMGDSWVDASDMLANMDDDWVEPTS